MTNNITAFLADLGAVLPEDFESAIDDVLELVADDVSHLELVAPTQNLNMSYKKKTKPKAKASISDAGETICDQEPTSFPIHKRQS